jgi:hypothetical protein
VFFAKEVSDDNGNRIFYEIFNRGRGNIISQWLDS